MGIQLNTNGVLGLACAVFLAGAIGFGAMSERADECATPRADRSASIATTDDQQPCEVAEHGETRSGRPGLRFME